LVINPNTNPLVTERIRTAALDVVSPNSRLTVCNPLLGPFAIEDATSRSQAEPNVLALIASQKGQYDAIVLACFDDIALDEARRIADVPVVGAVEAAIHAAMIRARRFAVVTTVESAVPTIVPLVERYGAADVCTVRAAGIGVAEAATRDALADRKIAAAVRAAINQDCAEAIILGSGGLCGRANDLAATFGIPVIDAILSAIKLAEVGLRIA
jgi:allantoin racemase